jgi:hypothetical protein
VVEQRPRIISLEIIKRRLSQEEGHLAFSVTLSSITVLKNFKSSGLRTSFCAVERSMEVVRSYLTGGPATASWGRRSSKACTMRVESPESMIASRGFIPGRPTDAVRAPSTHVTQASRIELLVVLVRFGSGIGTVTSQAYGISARLFR